ncbi:FAD-dependent oxidoreductase [Naasia sp. SYSU D00057]|uniref:FAD-dependent oxidoreductase n=1 Tax=Naasia sp. SYSU D00057 TaxID=2817380 RepID=UPI001B30EE93|nr:FAD-dependent oxidoreductase [Naasia sp. SYSU D00057]
MRVLISGAGIAGLALARQLALTGTDVTVIEKAPGPRESGYMIDFFGPGYDAAEAMGVLPRIRELGYRVEEVAYCDDAGRARARLSYERFGQAAGGRLVSIMRPDLECALREQLPARVDLRYGATITKVDAQPDVVTATLSDGTELSADLLVGCDGIHSAVRALVFGQESDWLRPLGFATAAYTFRDAAAHAAIRGRFCLTDTLHRSMGFYGLRDGRVAVFAVHRTEDRNRPDDPRRTLRSEYASLGWLAPRALAACPPGDEVYYDTVAQVVLPSWSRGRVALLGDAAAAVSLLAGQGASLAVAGAYVLAAELAEADSIPSALDAYERRLRPLVENRQETGRRGARWFAPRSRWQRWLRRAALTASALPFGDRLVASALAGKPSALVTELGGARGDTRDGTLPLRR